MHAFASLTLAGPLSPIPISWRATHVGTRSPADILALSGRLSPLLQARLFVKVPHVANPDFAPLSPFATRPRHLCGRMLVQHVHWDT